MPLKLKSISPSRIKTFDMCKNKYFLTYNTDEKLKSNWGAVHGSLIHDVLENFSTGDDLDWTDRLYRGYGGTLETLDRYQEPEVMETPLVWAKKKDFADKTPYCDTCPYAQDDHCKISGESLDALTGCPKGLFEGSISMLQTTINRYEDTWNRILRDDKKAPIGVEYGFRINIPGTDIPMIGYMDLVIEEDADTIHVIDYKSGTWTQNYDECREDIQVKMYSLASRREFIDDVNNKGFNYKNVILTFDYFTKNPITLALTEAEDDATERFVLNKIKEIQSTKWIDRIVPNNEAFQERNSRNGHKYFKCEYLCDSKVCARRWEGKFKV